VVPVVKAVVITKALVMKALVKSTTAKCLVKMFAAAKSSAVNAATTVKDPSTAMEAAPAVPGIGR
jgi:hypothetical protein